MTAHNAKKLLAVLSIIIMLLGVSAIAVSDGSESALAQPTPFGFTYAASGNSVKIYNKIGSTKSNGELENGTLCLVDSSVTVSGATWHKVKWMEGQSEKQGYIKGADFQQLTIGGMLTACNADNIEYFKGFSEVAQSPLVVQAPTVLTAKSKPTATPKVKATPKPTKMPKPEAVYSSAQSSSSKQSYVLNTNTKKFHYPYCKSVNQMKSKNRRDVTDTREHIMQQGYSPCKNCNP